MGIPPLIVYNMIIHDYFDMSTENSCITEAEMLRYRVDIQMRLKEAGYSSYRLRREKLLSESTLQKLRTGNTAITLESLNVICDILQCQPGELVEWLPGEE